MFSPFLRRLSAFLVLAALCGSTVVPLFGDLHAVVDVACVEDAWLTDSHAVAHRSTTQVERVRQRLADDHCAACHLQRTMAGADDDAKRLLAEGSGPIVWVLGQSSPDVATRTVASTSTRGPPTLL